MNDKKADLNCEGAAAPGRTSLSYLVALDIFMFSEPSAGRQGLLGQAGEINWEGSEVHCLSKPGTGSEAKYHPQVSVFEDLFSPTSASTPIHGICGRGVEQDHQKVMYQRISYHTLSSKRRFSSISSSE